MVVLSVVEAFEGRRLEDPFWDEDAFAGASSAWVDPLGAFFLFLGAVGAAAAPFAPFLTEGDIGPLVGLEVGIVIELLGIIMPVPGPPPPATNDPGDANPAEAGPPGP